MKKKFHCACKKNNWQIRVDGYFLGHIYCMDCDTTINVVIKGIEFSC